MTEASGTSTVAAVQLSSGSDPTRNVETAIELIREAADRGATYIQVPEYFNYLGPARNFSVVSETVPGPTTLRLGDLARELNVTIHVGSLLETSPDPSKCYNTSVLLGSDGRVKAFYRKVHLFDIAVPDEIVHQESDAIAAGHQAVVVALAHFRLGLSICFDVRFAELYRSTARRSSPSRRRSTRRPDARTGTCSCELERSRTSPSSSPRRRSAPPPRASTRTAIR